MSPRKNFSIADIGLKEYLERSKDLHNELNYYHFDLCIKKRVSYNAIGRLFNVNKRTIAKWRSIYNQEKARSQKES